MELEYYSSITTAIDTRWRSVLNETKNNNKKEYKYLIWNKNKTRQRDIQ